MPAAALCLSPTPWSPLVLSCARGSAGLWACAFLVGWVYPPTFPPRPVPRGSLVVPHYRGVWGHWVSTRPQVSMLPSAQTPSSPQTFCVVHIESIKREFCLCFYPEKEGGITHFRVKDLKAWVAGP